MQELQGLIVAELCPAREGGGSAGLMGGQAEGDPGADRDARPHNQMVRGAKSLDAIEEVVCKIAACKSACRDAHG